MTTNKEKEPVAGHDGLNTKDYDGLNTKEVVASLPKRPQVELTEIESHERSHEDRTAVFNKLRYLRQKEPFKGYDALSTDKVLAALKTADLAMIKRVRGYERKFGARREVLEEVTRMHGELRVPLVSRDAAAREATEAASPAS